MTSAPRTPHSRPVNWLMQALSLFAFTVAALGVSILIFEVFNEPAFSLTITGIFALIFIVVGIIVIHVTPRVRGFASWGLDLLLGVAFSPLFLSIQETTLVGWKRMSIHIVSYFILLYVMSVYFNRRYPSKSTDSNPLEAQPERAPLTNDERNTDRPLVNTQADTIQPDADTHTDESTSK